MRKGLWTVKLCAPYSLTANIGDPGFGRRWYMLIHLSLDKVATVLKQSTLLVKLSSMHTLFVLFISDKCILFARRVSCIVTLYTYSVVDLVWYWNVIIDNVYTHFLPFLCILLYVWFQQHLCIPLNWHLHNGFQYLDF